MLRPYEAFARLGLACLVVLLVCAPTALGASGGPGAGPEKLWEEFPLNPTGERLGTSQQQEHKQPEFRPPVDRSSPATTQAARETSTPGSGGNAALLALVAGAGLLVALVSVGLVSVRVWHARHQPEPRPLPLRQWASSHASHSVVPRPRRLADATTGVEGETKRTSKRREDVVFVDDRLRRLYRRRSQHGFRPRDRAARDVPILGRISERVQRALWTADTIPVYVGTAAAIVLALLFVRWAG